jgi:hypothetical protein
MSSYEAVVRAASNIYHWHALKSNAVTCGGLNCHQFARMVSEFTPLVTRRLLRERQSAE